MFIRFVRIIYFLHYQGYFDLPLQERFLDPLPLHLDINDMLSLVEKGSLTDPDPEVRQGPCRVHFAFMDKAKYQSTSALWASALVQK